MNRWIKVKRSERKWELNRKWRKGKDNEEGKECDRKRIKQKEWSIKVWKEEKEREKKGIKSKTNKREREW